ncbi:hypothetical protein CIB84_012618 [Bambusicola thoracicus]|uniref:Uncharacterized protein n=1 Tax=Bambusicola thoracicus TaxID=9083 RepID=A0A2P4SHQ3_BAMTH|nr:hypothetical protein CIB84_012618 [Bambusicola thoracicus]
MAGPRRRRCIRAAFSVLSSSMKRGRRRVFFHTKSSDLGHSAVKTEASLKIQEYNVQVIPFQFLDEYCSYSEDSSHHSNSNMNVTSGRRRRGVKLVEDQDMPEAVALGDTIPSKDERFFLTPEEAALPAGEFHGDIYMAPENDFRTPVEAISEEKSAFSTFVVELYEPSQESGARTEAAWPHKSDCSSPMDIEPSKPSAFLETSATAALLPEWDSNVWERIANVSSSTVYH